MAFNLSRVAELLSGLSPSLKGLSGVGATLFYVGLGIVIVLGIAFAVYYLGKALKSILYLTPKQFLLVIFLLAVVLMVIGVIFVAIG